MFVFNVFKKLVFLYILLGYVSNVVWFPLMGVRTNKYIQEKTLCKGTKEEKRKDWNLNKK
jgi:hypothetical protein